MLDKSSDIYQKAKLIGDTEKSIPTQFVLKRNATGKGPNELPSQQTIYNIILLNFLLQIFIYYKGTFQRIRDFDQKKYGFWGNHICRNK